MGKRQTAHIWRAIGLPEGVGSVKRDDAGRMEEGQGSLLEEGRGPPDGGP
jgi:hypothetical protein